MTAGRVAFQLTGEELSSTPDGVLAVMDTALYECLRLALDNRQYALFLDLTNLHEKIQNERRDRHTNAEMLRPDAPWNRKEA